MLTITIPALELYDEKNKLFINQDEVVIQLEHSLVALSKWEAIWEKPFLGPEEKTTEETVGYIRCMAVTPDIPPETFNRLSNENYQQINDYVDKKMSATWFNDPAAKAPGARRKEIITAEIIYYWMISLNIPFECQDWHLARLFTLIKVCNQKNAPEKKMPKRDMVAERNRINAERKAAMKTSG